jgi:hypothetical protein
MDIARVARDLRDGSSQGDEDANRGCRQSNREQAFHVVTSDVWSLQRLQRSQRPAWIAFCAALAEAAMLTVRLSHNILATAPQFEGELAASITGW